jgi:hypothetical protein
MTLKQIASSYCIWVWGQWTRLSAFFVTTCIIAALALRMVQTNRRYNRLIESAQSAFRGQDEAREARSDEARDCAGRDHAEVLRKLDEILARLPEASRDVVATPISLSSSY